MRVKATVQNKKPSTMFMEMNKNTWKHEFLDLILILNFKA